MPHPNFRRLPWVLAVLLAPGNVANLLDAQEPQTQVNSAQAGKLPTEGDAPSFNAENRPSQPAFASDQASLKIPALSAAPMSLDFVVGDPSGKKEGGFTFYIGIPQHGESVEQLRQKYKDLEQRSHELARSVHASDSGNDPATSNRLRKQLRETVQQAFTARQTLQRAELSEYAQRLQAIQQSIDLRDKTSQQIVDRRVAELLDSNLKWESETPTQESARLTPRSQPMSEYSTPGGGPYLPSGVVPLRPGTTFRVEKVKDEILFWQAFGARFAVVGIEGLKDDKYRGGLRITALRVGGPAEKAGLHVGDILVGVANWETTSLENLDYVFQETAAKAKVTFHAMRSGKEGARLMTGSLIWDFPN